MKQLRHKTGITTYMVNNIRRDTDEITANNILSVRMKASVITTDRCLIDMPKYSEVL